MTTPRAIKNRKRKARRKKRVAQYRSSVVTVGDMIRRIVDSKLLGNATFDDVLTEVNAAKDWGYVWLECAYQAAIKINGGDKC